MDPVALLLKLVHIVLAMVLAGGRLGRWIVLDRAAESSGRSDGGMMAPDGRVKD